MKPELIIDPSLSPCPCMPVLIWADRISAPIADQGLPPFLPEIVARAHALGDAFWPAGLKERVRDMLRHGRYKPAGRGKPASEFLLASAIAGEFPAINGPVDVNNAVSLESGYPGSIFDAALTGERLLLRRGLAGESYVFNPSGQRINLEDLLLVCRSADDGWAPCGNPVKDAMSSKVNGSTRSLLAILFAPAGEDPGRVHHWAERFAQLLRDQCQASEAGFR